MSEQKRQKEQGREGGRGVGCVCFANLIQEKVCESDREKENAQEGGVKKEKT